jgi:hypothetical protein
MIRQSILIAGLAWSISAAPAGDFPPAPPSTGTTAVPHNDPRIQFWATNYSNFSQGSNATAYNDPNEALNAAVTGNDPDLDILEVVSLGRGGQITLTFPQPIIDGPGDDFAVFENAFDDSFLELAFVEVSADVFTFVRFPSQSQTAAAVPSYGTLDPTNIDGLAGKYRLGYGTPFDLNDVGLTTASHVRITDIVGDGTTQDTLGNPIYDPTPTAVSAGFDLDAVAVLGTTADTWRSTYFTTPELALPAVSGDLADPDGDALANIIERALNSHPRRGDSPAQRPIINTTGTHLQLTFPRSLNAAQITIHIDASTDLTSWTEIARSTNGAPLQPVGIPGASLISESGTGAGRIVTVHDSAPLSTFRNRFMHLRITSP